MVSGGHDWPQYRGGSQIGLTVSKLYKFISSHMDGVGLGKMFK